MAGGVPVSDLAEGLEEYLALRRSLGYKLERAGQVLADFVAELDDAGISHISTEVALSWAIDTTSRESSWRAQRLGFVRGFARYLHTVDPRHQVPPIGLVPRRRGRLVPYLFSAADIEGVRLSQGDSRAVSMTPPTRALRVGWVCGQSMRCPIWGWDRVQVRVTPHPGAACGALSGPTGWSSSSPLHSRRTARMRSRAWRRDPSTAGRCRTTAGRPRAAPRSRNG